MATGRRAARRSYPRFRAIDGTHPYKDAIPDGHVAYAARRMHGGEIVYFNYALAREMGLIPPKHAERMNGGLRRAVLEAFGLRIINEHDLARNRVYPERDRLPNTYMATRYLALQHPGRSGKTSGDGRSVWNGTVSHRGITWDLTSCGTGVTRLCPATASEQAFFKTGNRHSDYGCGTATVEEGLVAALMSESFHRNGIATERVLAILELADGFAINVRAGRNLLRPSHFFVHLKQGRLAALRAAIECFIDRQVTNGEMPPPPRGRRRRYRFLAESVARTFARIAATFEREYIFCWLDWDGDNILADGGIIDYGSVRQFGLFHREYRFDDGPRWSTTITEQRRKARHIVQTFAQIRDFLIHGSKPPLKSVSRDPVLRLFDVEFRRTRDRLLLRGAGFDDATVELLLTRAPGVVRRFDRAHAWFERARSARGPRPVADGISWNAIYSTRDLMRELPQRLLARGTDLAAREILDIALSSYASERDRRPTDPRLRQARRFRRAYLALVEAAARGTRHAVPLVLGDLAARSAILNRHDRITGDGALYAAARLVRQRRRLGCDGVHEVVRRFAEHQSRRPENRAVGVSSGAPDDAVERVLDRLNSLVADCRHGL